MQTGLNLRAVLASAESIYVSACGAEITAARELLHEHRPARAIVTGIFSPLVNRRSYADPDTGLRARTFFLNKELKQHLASGLVEYCPWRYGVIDRWLSAPQRFDTALIMISPPDEHGRCSLGVQADFLPSFFHRIERVVGFVNPHLPRTAGDTLVDYSALTAVVDYDVPLVSLRTREPDAAAVEIAKRITELVPDGATVQFGVGQIPSQVLARLGTHRRLRVHSGVIDDNILTLEQSGALDRDVPIVTGTAVGTAQLYEALGDAKRFSFRAVAHTHAYDTIVRMKCFTAINSVLQADLLGQVSAEGSGGSLVASPGGLPDFVRGALGSEGGKSIVAVRARSFEGHPSGIVPMLGSPSLITAGAVDADVLVTEFGAAQIRHLSLDQRAEAIIAIAAPEDQQGLAREWSRIRARFFGA
jgi:acyl-CoA hydrolase